MAPPTKHTLFYSRSSCEFSKEVVDLIVQRGLRDRFTLICVETYPNIPAFVNCVPLAYTTKGEILTDDDLVFFIRNINTQQQQQQQQQQQKVYGGGGSREDYGDISFHNDKLSDMFSFIDNEDNMAFNKDYEFIEPELPPNQQPNYQQRPQQPQAQPQIQRRQTGNPTFPDPIDTRRSTSKTDGSELERLIAQRDAEIGGMTQRTI